ncbi:hypothetical protein GGI43DRAFT_93064 [Trichoderma evansii]
MPCCDTLPAQPQSLNSTLSLPSNPLCLQACQQSVPNPRISQLPDHTKPDLRRPAFAGHSSPSIRPSGARASVNLDHKQSRCPIDRAAHLLAFVTANSTTPGQLRPLTVFVGALLVARKAVMGSDRSCCDCHGNDASPVVGLIPSTNAIPPYESSAR